MKRRAVEDDLVGTCGGGIEIAGREWRFASVKRIDRERVADRA